MIMADREPYTIMQVIAAMLPAIDRSEWSAAGAVLGMALYNLVPDGLTFDEWQARVDHLDALINRPEGVDHEGVLVWLDQELPPLMGTVPVNRRTEFAQGVIRNRIRDSGMFLDDRRGRRRTRRVRRKPN
jgi:hypothetical protein